MPNRSLYIYLSSNNPDNKPINQGKDCSWGPYMMFKRTTSGVYSGIIIYIGDNFIVRTNFNNTTQSLNW